MQIADLHIHSRYSRATSKDMNIRELARYAKIKGIDILGTGDFTHPRWLEELKLLLKEEDGIYKYNDVKFILSGEVSLIYTQDNKLRKIHNLILAPDFSVVDQINEWLSKKGRLDYDGRPTFGFSCVELVENLMSISRDILIIPSHIWTPWYSLFGSFSGFDSVEECFGEKTKFIYALETGLSSDPKMNWRISKNDDFTLVSNSDSHSPHPLRLGREANVFDLEKIDYFSIVNAIKTRKNFLFTIEVDPAYGKYHYDGHRNCKISLHPKDAIKNKNICPKCGSRLTIGVLHRVEELADREENFKPEGMIPFKSIIPLSEIISNLINSSPYSNRTQEIYNQLVSRFGSEFNVLLNTSFDELKSVVKEKIANAIIKNREGKIKIQAGYDGVYGKLILNETDKRLEEFLR